MINKSGRSIEATLLSTNMILSTPKGLPTRINPQTGDSTTIDLVMANPRISCSLVVDILQDLVLHSDHNPVIVEIGSKYPTGINERRDKFRTGNVNWDDLTAKLKDVNIRAVIEGEAEIDKKIEAFQDHLVCTAKEIVPFGPVGFSKRKKSAWWNEECLNAKKEVCQKRMLYRRYNSLSDFIEYKKAYASFKRIVLKSKREAWNLFLASLDFRKPASKVYQFIKSISNKMPAPRQNPPLIFEDKALVEDKEKANAGAAHLIKSIGKADPNDVESQRIKRKIKFLSSQGGKEEYNQPFTLKELEDIIQGLPLTSPGPDLIHPHFVRSLPPNWTSALLDILNLAWSQGKFPTVWKYAEAVMIPKGGKDLSKLENHRMISLLPVLGKVYERIVKKRLNFEIERRKLLKDIQCGFRRKRSTIDCLNCIKQDALYAMQNNWIMLLVMLDVEGAFNNIVHRQILSGLIEAGFKGSLIAFVEDYMKQRTIKVRVKGELSDVIVEIKRGVPQGSALGPDLYNIGEYNIPIEESAEKGCIFADDNNVWVLGRSMEEIHMIMESVLEQLQRWADDIDLRFSPNKTKAMIFTRKKILVPPLLHIYGQPIEYVNESKILGCVFDKQLSWNSHVQSLKTACMKRLNILKGITAAMYGLHPDLLLDFYVKYIRAKLEYAVVIYGSASPSLLSKLDVLQNSAIRTAYGGRSTTPIPFLLSESGLEDLESRRNIAFLRYIRRILLAGKNHPVKSRIIKTGRACTKNPKKVRNQLNFWEKASEISASKDVNLKTSEFLSICEVPDIAPWEIIEPKCNLLFPTKERDMDMELKIMLNDKYKNYIEIYTDGSKLESPTAVGAAFWIPKMNVVGKYKLYPEVSVFVAEAYAILKALEFAESMEDHEDILICSDSMSVLEALKNFGRSRDPSREIAAC